MFGKNSGPLAAFMEANFRAMRFFACCNNMDHGGSRHFPIWQHLGISRQQPNIAKATPRFLSYFAHVGRIRLLSLVTCYRAVLIRVVLRDHNQGLGVLGSRCGYVARLGTQASLWPRLAQ